MAEEVGGNVPVHPEVFSGLDFESGNVHLVGVRCMRCDELFFPRRLACPRCHSTKDVVSERLPEVGQIYALTCVARPAALYSSPYVLALVDLENGPRILAQVKGLKTNIRLGARVRTVIEPLFDTPQAQRVWGYRFMVDE